MAQISCCPTTIVCGQMKEVTKKFNSTTTIQEIHHYICSTFLHILPKSYRIMYYDRSTMTFVDLEHQLRNEINPFLQLMNTYDNAYEQADFTLYILNDPPVYPSRGMLANIECDKIVSNFVHSNILFEKNHLESKLLVHSVESDENVLGNHNEDSPNVTEDILQEPTTYMIESERQHDMPENRLSFKLDVNPVQRDVYMSDEFSVRSQKSNGHIAHIQGVKRAQQKMNQILPRLQIPPIKHQSNVKLFVIAAQEQISGRQRIWYIHQHKGFLPEKYAKDTIPMNPITFDLNRYDLPNGIEFLLSLKMITKWNKCASRLVEVYRMNEENVLKLHRAEHDDCSPRLLCVLKINEVLEWNTLCLSDFIRSPKLVRSKSFNVSVEPSCSPQTKRPKLNHFTLQLSSLS